MCLPNSYIFNLGDVFQISFSHHMLKLSKASSFNVESLIKVSRENDAEFLCCACKRIRGPDGEGGGRAAVGQGAEVAECGVRETLINSFPYK